MRHVRLTLILAGFASSFAAFCTPGSKGRGEPEWEPDSCTDEVQLYSDEHIWLEVYTDDEELDNACVDVEPESCGWAHSLFNSPSSTSVELIRLERDEEVEGACRISPSPHNVVHDDHIIASTTSGDIDSDGVIRFEGRFEGDLRVVTCDNLVQIPDLVFDCDEGTAQAGLPAWLGAVD